MADKAHALTDKEIERMERHLSAIYRRAEKELTEKAEKYFARFEKLDEQKRALADAGKMTEQEYKRWRQGKIMTGKHWTAMKEQVAQDILNVNRTAQAYINDQLPKIYSINYNSVGESVESAVKGYSFDLVDAATVKNLATSDKTLLPYKYVDGKKDVRWNTQKVNSEIMQGIIQGESVPKMAKRLQNVTEMNRVSAIRNARTTVTSAENKGRMDMLHSAQDKGVEMEKIWRATSDSRTRDSHAALDGETVGIDEEFDNGLMYPGDPDGDPSEVYNCFLGETNVASNSEIIRSYKHKYSGKIVTVKTAGGVNFSCTPNHPILTIRGWIPAERLQNGDDLIVTFCGYNVFSRVNPNINHAFPRIDAIHELFYKLGGKRTCSLSVDFHGDIPTSNVEIITKKRLLRNSRNPSAFDAVNKFLFKNTDKSFLCKSSFVEHFWRICKSAFSFVGSFCKSFPFLWRGLRHSKVHRLRPIALLYSGRVKPLNDNVSRNAELIGECLNGFSGVVFEDNVISVDFSSGCSHVYNLQTENGYYFVNSSIAQRKGKSNGIFAIAHNCRCTLTYKVVGFGKSKDVPVNKRGEEIEFDIIGLSEERQEIVKNKIYDLTSKYETGLQHVEYEKRKSIGDEKGRVDVSGRYMTLYSSDIVEHEFFHTLDMSKRTSKAYKGEIETNESFWKESKKLFHEYRKESGKNYDVRISEYSETNVDEFMAEAFAAYWGGKPNALGVWDKSPYVEKAIKIIDKYFKK